MKSTSECIMAAHRSRSSENQGVVLGLIAVATAVTDLASAFEGIGDSIETLATEQADTNRAIDDLTKQVHASMSRLS